MPLWRRGGGRDPEELLAEAEHAMNGGRPDDALRLAGRAQRALGVDGDPEARVAALLMASEASYELERFAEALDAADQACAIDPDDPAAWEQRGSAAYRLGRFEEAVEDFAEAVRLDPRDAQAWHGLGRARLWLEDRDGADSALRRAAEVDPHHYVRPVRIAAGEFDRIAAEALASIPAAFRARLGNAIVAVEPLPDREEVEDGLDPDLLGLYSGATALADDGFPERILLYQRNHETVCGDLGTLRQEIRHTILHEVGHHFGMEEREMPY